MPCPVDGRFTAALFKEAVRNFDLWQAGFCAYGAPLGELVVGTIFYTAVSINIFLRTGSLIIPFVLFMILGGIVGGQMLGVINTVAGLIILMSAPVVVTAIVVMLSRR